MSAIGVLGLFYSAQKKERPGIGRSFSIIIVAWGNALFFLFGFLGVFEECQWEVAIAVGILVEIFLVVLLGAVEAAEWFDFDAKGKSVIWRFGGEGFLDDGKVGGIDIVDAGAIAGAFVFALLVEACGVDGFEVHLQQELEAYHLGIVL